MELTPKQKAFADYYIELGNATEAAIKAGYNKKTARQIGSMNLTKVVIKGYINERMNLIESDRIAKADEVLQYLTRVMRGEETEQVVVTEGTGEGCSRAKKIDKDVSVKDRNKAAELLAKRYGILTEKLDVNAEVVVFNGEDDLED